MDFTVGVLVTQLNGLVAQFFRPDVDRLSQVIRLVLAVEAVVQNGVVIPLVDNGDAVVVQKLVYLVQGLDPVGLLEQMGESVAQADYGVELLSRE